MLLHPTSDLVWNLHIRRLDRKKRGGDLQLLCTDTQLRNCGSKFLAYANDTVVQQRREPGEMPPPAGILTQITRDAPRVKSKRRSRTCLRRKTTSKGNKPTLCVFSIRVHV